MESGLSELGMLERIIEREARSLEVRTLCTLDDGGRRYPVHAVMLGSASRDAPAVGFFGGFHGLERIGTQVLLAFLAGLTHRLAWDASLRALLDRIRLVFVPLVNPVGMHRGTRCNGAGVDLMRNAPLDAQEKVATLVGGQRLSRRLPWFRGGATMETEAQAVCDLVRDELFGRPLSLVLDCHSGFGFRDRIWFPYAHSRHPIAHLGELFALHQRFERTHPKHSYTFEPQSMQYRTHGDVWDYLYQQSVNTSDTAVFLPLTLEMGSWRWIRKHPAQLASLQGYFNPLPPERRERVLQQHQPWLEFLADAAGAAQNWLPAGAARLAQERLAYAHWYGARR